MKQANDTNSNENGKAPASRPHAMLGTGQLAASIWKRSDTQNRFVYRFNVFRMSARGGRVTQEFTPADILDLARLTQLLAIEISDDGCLDEGLRNDLSGLAACLDALLPTNWPIVPSLPPQPPVIALRQVVRYLLDDKPCFVAESLPQHIYQNLLLVARWIDGVLDGEDESTS